MAMDVTKLKKVVNFKKMMDEKELRKNSSIRSEEVLKLETFYLEMKTKTYMSTDERKRTQKNNCICNRS